MSEQMKHELDSIWERIAMVGSCLKCFEKASEDDSPDVSFGLRMISRECDSILAYMHERIIDVM